MKEVPAGRLVVVSGPSGTGKTTVLRQAFACAPVPLVRSVSATTRSPRPGEVDGEAYHFLTPADFQARRSRGEFLECFEVFGQGHWYGTLESAVASGLEAGKWVLLEIDVKGALAVVEKYPDAITVFLRPPSLEVLEKRLRGRRTENEEAIQRRLAQARAELGLADRYGYQVVNEEGSEQRAAQEICEILKRQRRSNGYA
jgi:guanylate kinase